MAEKTCSTCACDKICDHNKYGFENCNSYISADVVEVKRGHWIEDEVCVYACSECGFTFTSVEDISEFKYCRCGADMRGEEK